MGGTGSGRRTPRSKKTSTTSKFTSNLTSLGFANGLNKQGVTPATTNDYPESHSNVITPNKDPLPDPATLPPSMITPSKLDNSGVDNLGQPPVEKPMIPDPQQDQFERSVTTYKTKVEYRSSVKDPSTDVVKKMRGLMARLFQYDKSTQMLPYNPANKTNPLTTSKDIPIEVDEFAVFVPYAFIHNKSKVLKMFFRISSNMPLWRIKQIPAIKNYLNQCNIYLDQAYLYTTDNVKVGCLLLSHCQFTRRDAATKNLNKRINENESLVTPVQLCHYSLRNGKDSSRITTKLLAVECSREHMMDVKKRLFTKMLNLPKSMEFSNTRHFKFMPFSATGAISDKVIRAGIYLQNKFLTQCTAITMIHLKHIEWIVPSTEDTFCAVALRAAAKDGDHKLFTSVEKGIGEQKVHLLTTKDDLEDANEWVDQFTTQMVAYNHESEFWIKETGFPSPPERINRPDSSDAHQAYANFLGQSLLPSTGEDMENNAPKNPPSRPLYSRVVYGSIAPDKRKDQRSRATASTQDSSTTASSLTSDPHEAAVLQKTVGTAITNMNANHKKDNESLENTLLKEMRSLNDSSSQRLQRIEEDSSNYGKMMKEHEQMMKELHANNMAKATEIASYEKRISQIGQDTAATASKMNTTAIIVDNTALKVDKLHTAMKAFVKVMADAVGVNNNALNVADDKRQHLLELADFLENDDSDTDMDDEDPYRTQDTPSPDAETVLGGEGIQK